MDKWDDRFMQMVDLISTWASCYQENRKMGAVITKQKRVLATGYNGAPAGIRTCVDKGECLRRVRGIASGTQPEICYAVHAEQNAILQCAKLGIALDGATLYVSHRPCSICAKLIVNAGIVRVVYREDYPDEFSPMVFEEAGVKLERYT